MGSILKGRHSGMRRVGARERMALILFAALLVVALAAAVVPLKLWIVRPLEVAAFKERNATCLGCHQELLPQVRRQVVHEPVLAGRCGVCHEPHRLSEAARTAVRHGDLAVDGVRSGARGGGGGGGREAVRVTLAGFLLPAAAAASPATASCSGCHDDIGRAGPGRDHPLTDEVECLTCHAAHASGEPGRLVAEPEVLCARCHALPEGHTEHSGLDCLECHVIHGSKDAPLLRDEATDVCVRCHPEAEGIYDHPSRPTVSDPNAGTGLTCTSSCHDPHGGAYQKMMRCPYGEMGYGTDALCLKCHRASGLP